LRALASFRFGQKKTQVHPINRIGHPTGKQTITWWAESAKFIELPRGLAVDYAQGCGVSRPQRVQRAAIAWEPLHPANLNAASSGGRRWRHYGTMLLNETTIRTASDWSH